MTPPFRSLRLLDEVQHLHQLETFAPEPFVQGVAAEVAEMEDASADDLAHKLDAVRGVLGEIDGFAQKCMGIRLTHALAAAPLPPQLRTLLKSTVLSYQSDLPLLRTRLAAALGRLDAATSAALLAGVMDAAERVIAGRADLRDRLFALAGQLAAARLPAVIGAARSRAHAQAERQRWGQVRVDLEQLAAAPHTLASGTSSERLARIALPPDDPEPEPTRGSLLDLD